MQDSITLQPVSLVSGEINLPGSKSVSNRALLLAALAEGSTRLTNLLDSDDVRYMLAALRQLGVSMDCCVEKRECVIEGLAGPLPLKEVLTLFLGNAGTAMRPLTAALSLSQGEVTLTGEPRMQERPIAHLVQALQQGGAEIHYLKQEGYPPLRLCGGFRGGEMSVEGSVSSQFLTALLMAAPLAGWDSVVHIKGELVSRPYIDITLQMMRAFAVEITHDNYRTFHIQGRQCYRSPGTYLIEGDASSASYFLAAAAIKGGTVRVTGIGRGSMQGDIHFATVLEQMGAHISWGEDFIECRRGRLRGVDLDLNHIPDAAMTIAVAAMFAEGETTIRNIYNWRVKETDRLAAMAAELRKVGATVEEGADFIRIMPPPEFKPAQIETYNDHRMAMCFSLVALSDTKVTILDPDCTAKTFPDYFQQLARLTQVT